MARNVNFTRRKKLWEENPNCYYCGCLTLLIWNPKKRTLRAATIEHTIPRLHPLRNKAQKLVIACWDCNNKKAVTDVTDYLTREQMIRRSMGKSNWQGWAKSFLTDLHRFDCF